MNEIYEPLLNSNALVTRQVWLTDEYGRKYNVVGVKHLDAGKNGKGKRLVAYRVETLVYEEDIERDGTFKIVRDKPRRNGSA